MLLCDLGYHVLPWFILSFIKNGLKGLANEKASYLSVDPSHNSLFLGK